MSSGASAEVTQLANNEGIVLGDPTIPQLPSSLVIGIRPGTKYGRKASEMSQEELSGIVRRGDLPIIRDPSDPMEAFVEVTDAPVENRVGEVEIDVTVAVTGETAFNEMMEAFANDEEKFEQIAEGLFVNGFIVPEENLSEIYEYENVVNGMYSAIIEANKFARAGGGALGRMPTLDGLLKSTDPDVLQAKFNEITASKKPAQYSRNTIIAMADKAASTQLQRGLSNKEMQAVIAAVHNLPGDEKMVIGSEVEAIVAGVDPQRATDIQAYNTAQNVKNALGLK